MKFAKDTHVTCEKSRMEIEVTLKRYGAAEFAFATKADSAMIAFFVNGRQVRFVLPMPDKSSRQFTHVKHAGRHYETERTEKSVAAFYEQACRQRWRALALCIKAKLEAVECGITTFEDEFLAHIVLANGRTIGAQITPQLDAVCRDAGSSLLLLEGRK